MKTAAQWALDASGSDGTTGDLLPLFEQAMADARRAALESIAIRLDERAATYSETHSACVALQQEAAAIRALLDDAAKGAM